MKPFFPNSEQFSLISPVILSVIECRHRSQHEHDLRLESVVPLTVLMPLMLSANVLIAVYGSNELKNNSYFSDYSLFSPVLLFRRSNDQERRCTSSMISSVEYVCQSDYFGNIPLHIQRIENRYSMPLTLFHSHITHLTNQLRSV